jgi:hypothetical protein
MFWLGAPPGAQRVNFIYKYCAGGVETGLKKEERAFNYQLYIQLSAVHADKNTVSERANDIHL